MQMKNSLISMMGAIALLGTVLLGHPQNANAIMIEFDDLRDRTAVDDQYRDLGVDFGGSALAISTTRSLNSVFFPPNTRPMVVADSADSRTPGIIRVDAVDRFWTTVGGYVTGRTNVILTAFNLDNQVLGETAVGGANYACANNSAGQFLCPGTGIQPNYFLNLSFPQIAYVTFSGDTRNGNSFTLDDFTFQRGAEIPTPAMLPGMIGLGIQAWRKRSRSRAA
jgi:hypothetical protein